MIQVEFLERFLSGRTQYEVGDRATVPDDDAKRWCGKGLARAVRGEIPTGPRTVMREVVLEPHDTTHVTEG